METIEKNTVIAIGILKRFKANKHGDIDALEINANEQILKINFPPHTAKMVSDEAKEGDEVTVTYEEKKPEHDPKGAKKPKLKLLSLSKVPGTQLIIADLKPRKSSVDSAPEVIRLDQFELLKGKKGELFGIRSGKQLIHIHKEDEVIADKIKADSKLEITASKRTYPGFINENGDDVFHIEKIIIDGQEYIPKK